MCVSQSVSQLLRIDDLDDQDNLDDLDNLNGLDDLHDLDQGSFADDWQYGIFTCQSIPKLNIVKLYTASTFLTSFHMLKLLICNCLFLIINHNNTTNKKCSRNLKLLHTQYSPFKVDTCCTVTFSNKHKNAWYLLHKIQLPTIQSFQHHCILFDSQHTLPDRHRQDEARTCPI